MVYVTTTYQISPSSCHYYASSYYICCNYKIFIYNFVLYLLVNLGEMEEIIQILFFVGAMIIAVIGQNAKKKKKPMVASPQEVLEDIFPEIEIKEETKVVSKSKRPIPSRNISSVKKKNMSQTHSLIQRKDTSNSGKKINLNQKSEAKRAFIYSEIFNRKF